MRSSIPSNSLASVYGLLAECADNKVLGPDVDIEIDACDECNTVVNVKRITREIKTAGGGFVGLVGVQSNQFPRAVDIGARVPRRRHSGGDRRLPRGGCISMLPELPPDLKEALDLGITLFAGEAEGRMADPAAGHRSRRAEADLQLSSTTCPSMAGATFPILPEAVVERVSGKYASFDAGRGCPFQCSFCTIINVQGRKSRYRTADDVEAIIRANCGTGRDALLHHRRQLRPQQELGADLRPHHRAARAGGHPDQAADPGGHDVPPHSALHREGRARRLQHASSSAWRTSIPNP